MSVEIEVRAEVVQESAITHGRLEAGSFAMAGEVAEYAVLGQVRDRRPPGFQIAERRLRLVEPRLK